MNAKRTLINGAYEVLGLKRVGGVMRAEVTSAPGAHEVLGSDFGESLLIGSINERSMELVASTDAHAFEAAMLEYRSLQGARGTLLTCHDAGLVQFGPHAGTFYFVSERITCSLPERLERGPLSAREAASILRAVTRGLAHIHARGWTHGCVTAERVVLAGSSWKLAPPIIAHRATRADDLAALARLVGDIPVEQPAPGQDAEAAAAVARTRAMAPQAGMSAALLWLRHEHPRYVPPTATAFTRRRVGDLFEVTWQPPLRGRLEVLQLFHDHSVSEGEVIANEDVDDLGTPVHCEGAKAMLIADGAYALVQRDHPGALVARIERPSLLDEVQHAGVQARGSVLHLTFVWPEGVHSVRVVWADGAPPTSPRDARAQHRDVSKIQYARAITISWRPGTKVYGRVFTRSPQNPDLFSAGVAWESPAIG